MRSELIRGLRVCVLRSMRATGWPYGGIYGATPSPPCVLFVHCLAIPSTLRLLGDVTVAWGIVGSGAWLRGSSFESRRCGEDLWLCGEVLSWGQRRVGATEQISNVVSAVSCGLLRLTRKATLDFSGVGCSENLVSLDETNGDIAGGTGKRMRS